MSGEEGAPPPVQSVNDKHPQSPHRRRIRGWLGGWLPTPSEAAILQEKALDLTISRFLFSSQKIVLMSRGWRQATAEFSEESQARATKKPYHTQGVCQTHTSGMEMGVLPCVQQQIPFSSLLSSKIHVSSQTMDMWGLMWLLSFLPFDWNCLLYICWPAPFGLVVINIKLKVTLYCWECMIPFSGIWGQHHQKSF